jgi:hypothetical protein
MGVQLLGRLAGVEGHRAYFADDLADSVAFGDARYADIEQLLTDQLGTKGMAVPELPDPPPFHATPPLELDLHGFGAVVFTSGFRPDYGHWVRFPAFDAMGYPLTEDGASSVVPRLFSAASTSCVNGSRRCCSAWARTPRSWRNRSRITNPSCRLRPTEGPRPAMAAATAAYSTLSALAASRSRAPAGEGGHPAGLPGRVVRTKRTVHRA